VRRGSFAIERIASSSSKVEKTTTIRAAAAEDDDQQQDQPSEMKHFSMFSETCFLFFLASNEVTKRIQSLLWTTDPEKHAQQSKCKRQQRVIFWFLLFAGARNRELFLYCRT
jgi:hypothetical protein